MAGDQSWHRAEFAARRANRGGLLLVLSCWLFAIGWILAVFANDARADFYDGNPEMRTGAPSSSPGQQKSLVGNEEASDAALTRRAADGKPAGNQETKAQPMR